MGDKHVAYAGSVHSFFGKNDIVEMTNKYYKEIHVKQLRTYSKAYFNFDDGGIQGWTIDQLYDHANNKLITTSGFTLQNTQPDPSLYPANYSFNTFSPEFVPALAAYSGGFYPTNDPNIKYTQFSLNSPDLSNDPNWQDIRGYSFDFLRLFHKRSGVEPLFDLWDRSGAKPKLLGKVDVALQFQIVVTDEYNNPHVLGETDENDIFMFRGVKTLEPYYMKWVFPQKILSLTDFNWKPNKIKQLRIRVAVPGYYTVSLGETGYIGSLIFGFISSQ